MVSKDRTEYKHQLYLKTKQKKLDEAKLKAIPPPPVPVIAPPIVKNDAPLTRREKIRLKRLRKAEYDRLNPSWLDRAFNRLWWFEDGEDITWSSVKDEDDEDE